MQRVVQAPVVEPVLVPHAREARASGVGGAAGDRDGAGERRAGIGRRRGRRGVVDAAVGDRRGARVAGAVGRDGAHVAQPVGDRRRVEGAGVGRHRPRARHGPGAGAGGRGREHDGGDAAVRRRRGGDRNRAAQRRAGVGQRDRDRVEVRRGAELRARVGARGHEGRLRGAHAHREQHGQHQQAHEGSGEAAGEGSVRGHGQRDRARARDSGCYRPIPSAFRPRLDTCWTGRGSSRERRGEAH